MAGLTAMRSGAMILMLALSTTATAHAETQVDCKMDEARFQTDRGWLSITVELADDPQERAQGLMFRRSLDERHGMLFVYEQPQPSSFWMRNTLIPLDIIFMDATGTVRHVHENARPLDETPIPGAAIGDPDPLRLMVLEIGGGEARRLGIQPGQAMAHPLLPQDEAAIPCE